MSKCRLMIDFSDESMMRVWISCAREFGLISSDDGIFWSEFSDFRFDREMTFIVDSLGSRSRERILNKVNSSSIESL